MLNPVDTHVGKRLRMRRTILGMSQEALGNVIGVTFQQIQKYERGANRIGAGRLFDFSQSLNVPVSYFFEDLNDNNKIPGEGENNYHLADSSVQEFEHERLSSRETLEMMRSYYRINDPQIRKRSVDLIRALADPAADAQIEE